MTLDLEFQKRVLLSLTCFIVANIASLNLLEIDWIKNRLDGDINRHETRVEIIKKITGYFFLWILVFIILYSLIVFIVYVSISMWLHIFDPRETNGFASGVKWVKNLFWKWKDGASIKELPHDQNLLYYWIVLIGAICFNLLYLPYLSSPQNNITSEKSKLRQQANVHLIGLDFEKTSPIVVLTNFFGMSIVGITILFIILLLLPGQNWGDFLIVAPILLFYLIVNCWTIKANLEKKYLELSLITILPVVLVVFWILSNYRMAHIDK